MTDIYDLIIVGGGMNGSALARLSAFNGLKVLLLDQSDFASGSTSNNSIVASDMLSHPSFLFQKEYVEEKENLYNTAPNVVWFEKFILPNVKENIKRSWFSHLIIKLQSLYYRNRFLKPVSKVTRDTLLEIEPHFRNEGHNGGLQYWDCMIHDTRLVIEQILDACYYGAEVQSYHEVTDLKRRGDIVELIVMDTITGVEKVYQTDELAFTAGPWVHNTSILDRFDVGQTSFTKGDHLFVEGLPLDHSFVLPVPDMRYYFLIVPWMGGHLVGSIQQEIQMGAKLTSEFDVHKTAMLLDLLKEYFPGIRPHVVCTFSGHRENVFKSSGVNTECIDGHYFQELGEDIYFGTGGKHLSHRSFARGFLQFMYDRSFATLENNRLPGGKKWVTGQELWDELYSYESIDEETLKHWMSIYGSRAIDIIAFIQERAGTLDSVDYVYYEALFCKEFEFVRKPVDFMCRRSNLVYSKSAGLDVYPSVIQAICPECATVELDPSQGSYYKYLREIRHCAVV
ncbi:MAG: FAD-dependent oxidoreductase [Fibrobacterales bacterium]